MRVFGQLRLLSALLFCSIAPVEAQTLWTANGVSVGSAAVANQAAASIPLAVTGLSGTQAVVAWTDVRVSSGSPGLYAQKLNGAGAVQWGASGSQISASDPASIKWQMNPFSDGSTGELFSWVRSDSTGTTASDGVLVWTNPQGKIQRADTNGTLQGSVFTSTAARYTNINQISDSAGNSFIAVRKYAGAWMTLYLQKITAAGASQWGPDPAGVAVAQTYQYNNSVKFQAAPDGSGGAYIFWDDTRDYFINNLNYGYDVFMSHVNPSGSVDWPLPKRVATGAGDEILSDANAVIPDGIGGFLAALSDGRLQRVNSQGTPLWGSSGVQFGGSPIQTAPDGSGGAYALWQTGAQGYVNWVKSNGNLGFGSAVLVSTLTITISSPVIASDGIGGVFAAWSDNRNGSYDIFAQHISTDGTQGWGLSGLAVSTAPNNQLYPSLANVSTGTAVVAWIDQRNVGNGVANAGEVFAQELVWNPATQIPVVSNISPTHGGNTAPVTVTMNGAGFVSGITVVLSTGVSSIPGTGIVLTGSTQLQAQFDLTGAAPGPWNLVLTNPSGAFSNLFGVFLVTGPFSVSQISPTSAPNFGLSTVTVSGAGFLPGVNLYLAKNGFPNVYPYQLTGSNATQINAQFNLRGATTTGSYDVVVVNPDLSTRTLAGAFTVTADNQIFSIVQTTGASNQIGFTANGANIDGMQYAWLAQGTTRQYAYWLTSNTDLLTYSILYSSFDVTGLATGWWDYVAYSSATNILVSYSRALYIAPGGTPGAITPAPFTGLTTTTLTANWTSTFPLGTTYYAQLSTGVFPNSFGGNITSTTTGLFMTFTGLTPNTSYYAQVSQASGGPFRSIGSTMTLSSGGGGGGGGTLTAAAFTGVTAYNLTANWTSTFAGGTIYYAYLSTGPFPNSFAGNIASTTTAVFTTFTGLTPNTRYYAEVSTIAAGPFTGLGFTVTLSTTGGGGGNAGVTPPFARKRALSPGRRDGINDSADFPGATAVSIYDLRGRLIFSGNSSGGSPAILWNGTDGAGNLVESGIYIASIRMTDNSMVHQAILVAR